MNLSFSDTYIHHPAQRVFVSTRSEGGRRTSAAPHKMSVARTLTESGTPPRPCHAEPGGDVRATRAKTPLPSPSMSSATPFRRPRPAERNPDHPRSGTNQPNHLAPDGKAEALHVTLAFLGNRPETDVDLIRPIVEGEHEAPSLALGNILTLKRVLAAELTGDLQPLQARVARCSRPRASTPPRRARSARTSRSPACAPAPGRPRHGPHLEPLSFHGTAVTLYASRLHPNGARYEALVRAPLGYTQRSCGGSSFGALLALAALQPSRPRRTLPSTGARASTSAACSARR